MTGSSTLRDTNTHHRATTAVSPACTVATDAAYFIATPQTALATTSATTEGTGQGRFVFASARDAGSTTAIRRVCHGPSRTSPTGRSSRTIGLLTAPPLPAAPPPCRTPVSAGSALPVAASRDPPG